MDGCWLLEKLLNVVVNDVLDADSAVGLVGVEVLLESHDGVCLSLIALCL